MSRKRSMFYSAVLLTGVNLLLRMVATSFQVYLSGTIGAEGIGLLQLVLSVGSMAMVAGMAGIRTATMYLTAEELGKKRPGSILWVLSGCTLYSIIASCSVGLTVYCAAPFIAEKWIGNPKIADAIRLFAVFLPVNCLCGVMVGYFTGSNRITTLAAVEIAEQFITMVCTILLLKHWALGDTVKSCQAVVLGSGLGGCLTLISLLILRLREPLSISPRIKISRRLCSTAIPLAMADNLRTGISTIENLMVPKRLALYHGTQTPLAAFGTVCGMVFPILTFPMALLFGLTELLIPELARCNAAGSKLRIKYLVRRCLRIGLFFGTLCAMVLYLCAEPLCMTFYKSTEAGKYLRWFSPLAVMLYCDAVTDAMIKGLGQQRASVQYNICTNVMDVAFLYLLLPKYGILGYFLSFTVTHVINFILSIRRLLKITGVVINIGEVVLTLLAAMLSVLLCQSIRSPLWEAIIAVIVLLCLLIVFGIVRNRDLKWIIKLIKNKK